MRKRTNRTCTNAEASDTNVKHANTEELKSQKYCSHAYNQGTLPVQRKRFAKACASDYNILVWRRHMRRRPVKLEQAAAAAAHVVYMCIELECIELGWSGLS